MEIDYAKENIKSNVRIIAWVIIGMHVLGIYTSSGGNLKLSAGENIRSIGIGAFPWYTGISLILSSLLGIAIIYYAAQVLQFKEKARGIICGLIKLDIILTAATFLMQIGFMFNSYYSFGFNNLFNILFTIPFIMILIYLIAVITMYYLFYKFLNKSSTKAVFLSLNENI